MATSVIKHSKWVATYTNDLNNLIESGNYTFDNPENAPFVYGNIQVIAGSLYIVQVAYHLNSPYETAMRTSTNGGSTWSGWQELALNSKLTTALDSTVNTVGNVNLNDYKTAGVYYFTTGCSNAPANYFLCLIITHALDVVIQIGMYAESKDAIKYRMYSTGSWGNWKTLAGT